MSKAVPFMSFMSFISFVTFQLLHKVSSRRARGWVRPKAYLRIQGGWLRGCVGVLVKVKAHV